MVGNGMVHLGGCDQSVGAFLAFFWPCPVTVAAVLPPPRQRLSHAHTRMPTDHLFPSMFQLNVQRSTVRGSSRN